jgi:hypothetical protein
MTARRRPPKKPGPTEPENGDHWADVILEKLHEHTALLEKQTVVVEQMRGQMVVLEQMRGQMDVVVERLNDTPTRGEFMGVVTQIEGLGGRMGLFEDVLRHTRRELGETRKELGGRLDGVDCRLDGVDSRLDGVDSRLDGVDSRLHGLEHEVRGVRQDVMRQAQGSELRALDQRMTVVERHLGI